MERQFPGYERIARLPQQVRGVNPFGGDCRPSRVPLFAAGSGRPCLPFPHPWNYGEPLKILESYFWGAEADEGAGRHNRYFEMPGFAPVFVTRDPAVIRAITVETGDQAGQFDRDSLPSTGIARATGKDSLLYTNGSLWRRQRRAAASPFGKTTLFQPELFHEFAETFRATATARVAVLRNHLQGTGQTTFRVALEPEIKAVMLEMLVSNFFGAELPYDELRNRYIPAIERIIEHIVRDTVANRVGVPVWKMPRVTRGIAQARDDFAAFDELTSAVLVPRNGRKGLWEHFKSDAPDEALRANLKVFLAGALEATTSFASWSLSHLSRNAWAQDAVYEEVKEQDDYTPEILDSARYLGHVLNETLRLTPALYFLPRRATADTRVETADGRTLVIPKGTHILLDVWHANRHEDHWGVAASGFPALDFVPERWMESRVRERGSKELLHFGFGHGPRVCPGKHLGQLEVGLVVGAFVKVFKFRAANAECGAKASVSTKPADGTLVDLELRN